MWVRLTLYLALAVIVNATVGTCSTTGCGTCSTALVSGNFVQTCTSCSIGFQLSGGACPVASSLIAGVAIGAIVLIIVQIILFLSCNKYFKEVHKRKTQYDLDQIFKHIEKDRKDPDLMKGEEKKYQPFHNSQTQCLFCKNFPLEVLKFQELERQQKLNAEKNELKPSSSMNDQVIDSQVQLFQEPKIINPRGPTVGLKCRTNDKKCFYHMPCLKIHLARQLKLKRQAQKNPFEPQKDVSCLCQSSLITPFFLVCIECKLKNRLINLQITEENIKLVKEYLCAICSRKRKQREEKLKWWKKYA